MQPILLTPSGELPNGLTPERCDALGLTPIMPSVQPAPAPGAQIVEAEPELVDGVYHQRWTQAPVIELSLPLPEAQEKAWQAIKTERDRRKSGGFFTGTQWFHSDESSRGQYGILLSLAVEKQLPVSYVLDPAWKDLGGSFSPMTVGKLRLIRDAGLLLERQLFNSAQAHRAAMEVSADPLAYDFYGNWPPSFEEHA